MVERIEEAGLRGICMDMRGFLGRHALGILVSLILLKVFVVPASLISALVILTIGLPGSEILAIGVGSFFEAVGIFLIVLYFTRKDPLEPLHGVIFGWVAGILSALIDAIVLSMILLFFLIGLMGMGSGTSTGAHDAGQGIGALIGILLVVGLGAILVARVIVGLFIGFVPGVLGAFITKRFMKPSSASVLKRPPDLS
jgi:hypothetical protein